MLYVVAGTAGGVVAVASSNDLRRDFETLSVNSAGIEIKELTVM